MALAGDRGAPALTVVGIKDYQLIVTNDHGSEPALRGQATLPLLIVERMNRAALLPPLRSFWLAFGLERPGNPFAISN